MGEEKNPDMRDKSSLNLVTRARGLSSEEKWSSMKIHFPSLASVPAHLLIGDFTQTNTSSSSSFLSRDWADFVGISVV